LKSILTAAVLVALLSQAAIAEGSDEIAPCDQLVALFIKLAEKSGETVTEAEARAEVMSESPSEAQCAAMQALFEGQN